ncbi:unnamed protein product [Rotaria sp. Silwood2]|nr:unnamed protein product [Rotaria sp. Silwood2]
MTNSANEIVTRGPRILKPLNGQSIDLATFKRFKFVLSDPLQIETRDIYDIISGTFQWEIVDTQDSCVSYIRTKCTNYRVFLITSGVFGRNIVPLIHDLPQVYGIYVYCANVFYHQQWAKLHYKVRVVCNHDDLYLVPQFAADVAQANNDWGNALLNAGKCNEAKEKFKKAMENINKYARCADPVMINEIKQNLKECETMLSLLKYCTTRE